MDTNQPPPAAPIAVMVSTPVPSEDGRPACIVHLADEVPPPFAPRCPADCWCQA